MEPNEVYIESLLAQYRVNRMELMNFTNVFLIAIVMIAPAWFINHLYHNFRLGWMIATVAMILGLGMATHCGNTLKTLHRITADLNALMGEHKTFDYDQGKETDAIRFAVTLAGKVIGALLLIWCFTPWPQF